METFWIFLATEFLFSSRIVMSLENMALRKDVWEDHPWSNVHQNWHAENAVDGRYEDRSAQGGQCVITENFHKTATWRVDLGSVVSISHIDIHYKTDNLPTPDVRLTNLRHIHQEWLDFFLLFLIQLPKTTAIFISVHGRYVIYYNERNRPGVTYPSYYSEFAYYELCELEVYGCSNVGYYGQNCNIPCPRNCQERRCDVNTGLCLGCVPGYHGLSCSEVCAEQTYGLECSKSCGNCSNGESCYHVNGSCMNGCSEGVQGETCTKACPVGFFGMNCLYKCNAFCAGNESCDHVTGLCDEGCKHGWNTPLCGYGGQYKSQSSTNNNLVVICVVVSVVIVLTGSVLNYIYWKRKSEHIVQERNIKEIAAGNVKTKTEEKPDESSEQYTELQEVGQVNHYEDLKA